MTDTLIGRAVIVDGRTHRGSQRHFWRRGMVLSPATLECLLRAELLDMPDAERVALLARLFRGICLACGSQRLPCGCAATK